MGLSPGELALLAAAGFGAGAVNAVAGGGSLISFPALLAVGYPSVTANVTNAVAVLPGYVGGSIGYRRELSGQRQRLLALTPTCIAGSAAGATLLLVGSDKAFEAIVPFLILFSCALLAVQPLLRRVVARPSGPLARHGMQFVAAVYGGYFGAGLGIMLLAILEFTIKDDLQRLNALKGLLSFVIGAVAAVSFALFGPVKWGAAAITAVASLGGGQAGVVLARRLPANVLRSVVVAFGVAVAIVLLAT